jgi:hypothetical protein
MTVDETLVACLQATSIGSAVYALVAPNSSLPPYCVYTQISGTRVNNMDGDGGLGNPHYQIDIYAKTQSSRDALQKEIRNAILAYSSLHAVFLNDGVMYEPDTKFFRHRQDFSIWFYN